MKHLSIPAAVAVAALALPAAASAHITLNPKQAPAGAFTELLVRVPNERDNASTTKVDVKFPPGFVFASYETKAGWSVRVVKHKLAKPVQTDDGAITEEVSRMIWTGTGDGGGRIAPGQFADFPISVQIPGKAGDALTFKALQTYSNGEVVRWIGAPSSDTPAPQVMVTDGQRQAAADHHATGAAASSTGAKPATASASNKNGGGSTALEIAAIVIGGLGLLAGGLALARSRRPRSDGHTLEPRTAR